MTFWRALWSFIWFGGVGIFSVLSILILVYGYKDLVELFVKLKKQHEEQQ